MKATAKRIYQIWLKGGSVAEELQITEVLTLRRRPDKGFRLLSEFWHRRPTRLFELLKKKSSADSQSFLRFLDQELARLPIALCWNHYSPQQLEHLRQLAAGADEKIPECDFAGALCSQNGLLAFPLLVETTPQNGAARLDLPDLVFGSFIPGVKSILPVSSVSFPAHQAATEMFLRYYPKFSEDSSVSLAMLVNGSGEVAAGSSCQLALLAHLWFTHHRIVDHPSICCTGAIDRKSGMVIAVSAVAKKVAAASRKGFKHIVIPADNLADLPRRPDNLVTVKSIADFFHWLLLNCTENGEYLSKLSFVGRSRFVAAHFSSHLARVRGSVDSPDERLKKMAEMAKKLPEDLSRFPAFLRFAFLPQRLHRLMKVDLLAAEQIYLEYALSQSSLDSLQASRIIRRRMPENFLRTADFCKLRRRFPLIMLLFCREPLEILHFYTFCQTFDTVDIEAIKFTIDLLQRKADKYCRIAGSNKCSDMIFQKVMRLLFPNQKRAESLILVVRKRLVTLYKIIKNVADKRCFMSLNLKQAIAALCNGLLELHLHNYLQVNNLEIGDFSDVLRPEELKLQVMLADPILRPLAQEILAAGKLKPVAQDKPPLLESAIKWPWLPNPGLVLARSLFARSQSLNFIGVLNSFSRHIYQEPAGELMNLCLAHWFGYMRAKINEVSQLPDLKRGKFALAYHIGVVSGCATIDCQKCDLGNFFRGDFALTGQLAFLLLLLPESCRECWLKAFSDRFLLLQKSDREIRKKDYVFCRTVAAVLAAKTGLQTFASAAEDWQKTLLEYRISPWQVRRTEQVMVPLFYLLTGQREDSLAGLEGIFHAPNRPFFVFEYLRCFILGESLLEPGNWHDVFEREIFSAIAVGYLATTSKELLRDYLLHSVADRTSFLFGLERLEGFAQFHRQPQ